MGILGIACFLALVFHPNTASADQGFAYAQIVCLPETDYLSVSTKFIWDVAPNGYRESSSVALINIETLSRRPFACMIKGKHVEVTADQLRISGNNEACRNQLGGINIRIAIDGKRIDTLRQADCHNRRYHFDASIDSDFPSPRTNHHTFFEHCVVDGDSSDYRGNEPSTVDLFGGALNCVTISSPSVTK